MVETIGRLWNVPDGLGTRLRGYVEIAGARCDVNIPPHLTTYKAQVSNAPDFYTIEPLFIRLWTLTSSLGSKYFKGHFGSLSVVIFKNSFGSSDADWNITLDSDQSGHPRAGVDDHKSVPPPRPEAPTSDYRFYEQTHAFQTGNKGFMEDRLALFKKFGLDEPYTLEHAKAVWRAGVHKKHPDRGGSDAAMIEFNSLYIEVQKLLNF